MSDQTRCCFISRHKWILIGLTVSLFSNGKAVTYHENKVYSSAQTCGALFSEPESLGTSYQFADQDQSVNLPSDQRATDNGWNLTQSLTVQAGCKLQICSGTYFDGLCEFFSNGSYSTDDIPSSILSASCSCPKECQCSNVHIKLTSCGRAYLNGGCHTCHTPYTDLRIDSEHGTDFPSDFREKVKALRIRKGCTLTTYSGEGLEGEESVIQDETVEDFHGTIGSYHCECDDSLYVPRTKPPRPEDYPKLVEISTDMNQVIELLKTDSWKKHPGLNSAQRSYRSKRSPKNAYILLLGSTGAGKSSAINFLFDNPNITKVGDVQSTTSSIHEFRITVPIDELGISNSELRIIDTPGMGDTRGIIEDAKYLATLDNYLATHEELKDRLPNVVLIFHKFHDNRFSGEGAKFVQMIRSLDYFRERITDDKYSNVIFVFSHFMSVKKTMQRRPDSRIKAFQKVIQDYSLYPRPTHLVVAENSAPEQDLPQVNGYYQLPNYDYYPRNLFEKLELITQKCGDPIGQGVFSSAFRDSENFMVSSTTHPLVSSNTTKVQRFLGLLNNANLNINNTEVSRHLQNVWEKEMDPRLKKLYPFSLAYLQKSLNLRHINSLRDVPRTTPKILELITAIKHDPATRSLLEIGLQIQAPVFSLQTVAGYGYHVFQDVPLTKSPFILGELQDSDIGFKIPSYLTCTLDPGTKENFLVFDNKTEYLHHRLQSLGIEGVIPVEKFTDKVQPGCNIAELSFRDNGCSISVTKDFRVFQLSLNARPKLTAEFQNAVLELVPFNESDHDAVTKWTNFFNSYGTHVVKAVNFGGSIQLRLETNETFNAKFADGVFNLVKFIADLTYNLEYDGSSNQTNGKIVTYPHSTLFLGGDPNFHSTDLGKMSVTQASSLLANWKKSLKLSPALLSAEMRLVPISLVAFGLGQNYTEEIERATKLLFNSDLTYKAPARANGAGPARDDTPVLVELMKTLQEQSQRLENLRLEMHEQEQELLKQKLQMEQDRMNFNREQARLNAEFQRQTGEMIQKAEQERRDHERKIELIRQQERANFTKELARLNAKFQNQTKAAEKERSKHEENMAVKQREHDKKMKKAQSDYEERFLRNNQKEHEKQIALITAKTQPTHEPKPTKSFWDYVPDIAWVRNIFKG